jgi:hypothetical protein
MGVVEQYWGGVLQRLRAEVDVFARLVQHVGERGRMNELALSRLLESFVPERVGVGTGVLIDSNDTQSQQTDVILFDRADQPAVMAQSTQVLFPVEVALACVEVKTTLNSGDVKDCLEKRATLHTLGSFAGAGDEAPAGHPPFVVLGYDAGLSPKGFVESFGRDLDNRPELLCVLEIGLVGGGPGVLRDDQTSWEAGLALAHEDAPGGGAQWVTADGKRERVEHEGRLVSVVDYGGCTYAADPGRALLLFADALARLVAKRAGATSPVLSHYLTPRARALASLMDAA